jgi:hypothetical protein
MQNISSCIYWPFVLLLLKTAYSINFHIY